MAEWADFISFLGRLLKVLQSAPKYNVIPTKLIVAKRLSQCLNPALPTGVHTRALDVYTHIFTVLGADGLRRDLAVWTPGLLPFFPHAATSIRGVVLGLYERFYLPLGVDLRPLTRALLLSLLPGLEEEGSEFFDRVVTLLDRIATSVQPAFFFQNMWNVLMASPSVRLCALNYLARRMPTIGAADAPTLASMHVSLLAQAMAHTLQDDALLVRRQALDFLITHMAWSSDVMRDLRSADKEALTYAALCTVLRRDISLNRRLYTWLVSAENDEQAQETYFQTHALPSARRALHDAMAHTREAQRPYKVLVSLMDKSTIAQPLLQAMVLDVFDTLVAHTNLRADAELYPTAQTLFEALEAHVLYQQLYRGMLAQMENEASRDVLSLCERILDAFRPHDEEAVHTHLPVLCLALVGEADARWQARTVSATAVVHALKVVEAMVQRLDASAVVATKSEDQTSGHVSLRTPAALWYGDEEVESVPTLRSPAYLQAWMEALLRMALPAPVDRAEGDAGVTSACWTLLDRMLTLLDTAVATLDTTTHLTLDVAAWNEALFAYIRRGPSFASSHAALRMAMRLSNSQCIDGAFDFATQAHSDIVMQCLLDALQPASFRHHTEAVALFWDVDALTGENEYATHFLCTQLTHSASACARAMDALGTLWRLSTDAARRLEAPVFLVLDRLRSHHVMEKHQSELWLCAYVSSYDTLLQLLLHNLVRVPATRTMSHVNISTQHGASVEVPVYEYTEPFDQAFMNYYLATLTSLLTIDGVRVLHSAQSTVFTWASDEASCQIEEGPISNVLKEYVLVLLRSMPSTHAAESDEATYALCLELLRLLLAMEPDQTWCSSVEAGLHDVLLLAMHRGDTPTQVLVLRTIREVLLVHYRTSYMSAEASASFASLLQVGLLRTTNDTALFAWMDLAHTLLPLTDKAVQAFMLPLCSTVRALLLTAMQSYDTTTARAWRPTHDATLHRVPRTELELNQLTAVLEHTLVQAMSSHHSNEVERVRRPETSGGFLGNISSVFLSDSSTASRTSSSHAGTSRSIADVVQALAYAWIVARADPRLEAVVTRTRAALERLYGLYTSATVDAIMEYWSRASRAALDATDEEHVLDDTLALLACLAPSAQIVCTSLCDAIAGRVSSNDRAKKQGRTSFVSEVVLFQFLDLYTERLDAPFIPQVWPIFSILAKSISSTTNKAWVFGMLRLVTQLGVKLATTRAFEDARMRRDVQDTFMRLSELTISLYARSLDISASSGRDSDAVSALSEKDDAGDGVAVPPAPAVVVQCLGAQVLPAYVSLRIDNDKLVAISTSMVYYVVAPGVRTRGRTLDPEPLVLDTLVRLSRMPTTIKTWRTQVLDAFMDAKFFTQTSSLGRQWAPIVHALLQAERERWTDVLGRINATPTSNLFTSREADLYARVTAIRRLSYVVYTGKTNDFLAQLPQIQEKVVEIVRSQPAEIVQAEVFLCMRVLLCRFASQHLTGFWPIILTEMLRILGEAKSSSSLPADKSDALYLIGSVAKLADYLITLQTEDFQIHQWLLITDTPDAMNDQSDWSAESLLDCIGALAAKEHPPATEAADDVVVRAQERKPMLAASRLDNAAGLTPFFANASRAFYECQFEGDVDWDTINTCLLQDLFEPIRTRL